MNLKLILATIVAVALVGAAAPATAGHSVTETAYIGGSSTPDVPTGLVLCQDPPGLLPGFAIGGGCWMECPNGCTVTATEDDGSAGAFEWQCQEPFTGEEGSAVGVAQVTCPAHVSVFMSVGSVSGVITSA